VDALAFEHHLTSPQGLGHHPPAAATITRGGGACGDQLTFSVALGPGGRIATAGFTPDGCGATTAAGSAAVTLLDGRDVLGAARIGAAEIAAELGGLSPGKLHAAELAADALARALGAALATAGPDDAIVPPPEHGTRTLVAMSGGVDSALAAHEAARGGAAVAVTLELWADDEHDAEGSCCSASAVAQARGLAHRMGLPHLTLDLRPEFRAGVVEPFLAGYGAGETPNPCVRCNGRVRLDALLDHADRLGCATLVTGHYAQLAETDHPDGPLLRTAVDRAKDQSYVLAALRPERLARLRFPLGELQKPEVRARARAARLPVADKPDSQDLCFLAGTDRARFLARHGGIGPRRGAIVDPSGRTLGAHDGHHGFTVGQRRGIGVAGPEPLYVLEKDAEENRVVVGPHRSLARSSIVLREVTLHRPADRAELVKLRYHAEALPARPLTSAGPGQHDRLELRLAEPAYGVAPGQLACLLDGELIVGYGTIARA
jgi:tRNA-specific 2-thiouridylase